jgi:Protein of unknown function (DUF3309)
LPPYLRGEVTSKDARCSDCSDPNCFRGSSLNHHAFGLWKGRVEGRSRRTGRWEEELDAIEEGIARRVSVLAASRSAKWNFGATRGFLGALCLEETNMPLGTILLIILVILLIGALPAWPYSAAWGPYPAGILGTVLIIVLILVLLGRL